VPGGPYVCTCDDPLITGVDGGEHRDGCPLADREFGEPTVGEPLDYVPFAALALLVVVVFVIVALSLVVA
jgi:hypothetical protein